MNPNDEIDKYELYDHMKTFLTNHTLYELLELVTDVSSGYSKNEDMMAENGRLRQELADVKDKIHTFSKSFI